MSKEPTFPTLSHAKKHLNEMIQRYGKDCPCSYYYLTDTELTFDMALHSYRIGPEKYMTLDTYKSSRLRHRLARFICRLLRV